MIIVADSGATKTAWRSVDKKGILRSLTTRGMNPNGCDDENLRLTLNQAVPFLNPHGERIEDVYFYGAGLVSDSAAAPIADAFQMWCPFARLHFQTDLMAAARALFGDGEGIAAIMGTGSNSGLYSEGHIVSNIHPGGYILGDEGGAANLGKRFISDYIKGLIPENIRQEFTQVYPLTYQDIVQKVYKQQGGAAFLASFAPFILEHADEPVGYIRKLVAESMDSFIKRVLCRYPGAVGGTVKIGVAGSFGYACQEFLKEAGAPYELEFVRFIKSPIEELVKYHVI